MPISFLKTTAGLAALTLVTACSSSTTPTPPPPPPDTTLNFNTNTTPPIVGVSTTQTGLASVNAITQAVYDQPADQLTLTRTGATAVTLTGSAGDHPSNQNLDTYKVTGPTSGTALVAHSAGGDGYAVAFYDNSTLTALDPQGSALVGGVRSPSGTNVALSNSILSGQYLGYANQTVGGLLGAEGTITGDVNMTLNGTGTGILAGTLVTNRQTQSGPLVDVTNGAVAVNGNLEFTNMVVNTTGLLGLAASGRADGAFFESDASNSTGEVVGSVLLRGGNFACNGSGDVTVAGRNCVMETGVFSAR